MVARTSPSEYFRSIQYIPVSSEEEGQTAAMLPSQPIEVRIRDRQDNTIVYFAVTALAIVGLIVFGIIALKK